MFVEPKWIFIERDLGCNSKCFVLFLHTSLGLFFLEWCFPLNLMSLECDFFFYLSHKDVGVDVG